MTVNALRRLPDDQRNRYHRALDVRHAPRDRAAAPPAGLSPTDFAMSREPTHSALLWIVAAAFFMQSLDTTIVNTALPSIAQSLQASPLAM